MKVKSIVSSLAAGVVGLLASSVAAQPGYGPPPGPPPPAPATYYSAPPGPVYNGGYLRQGGRLTLGVSLGVGAMDAESGPITCVGCDYNTVSAGAAFHIGGMLNPRLALMLEIQANAQTVGQRGYVDQTLVQSAVMLGAQYWATPRLWLKGGLGAAHLSFSYDDGYGSVSQPIDDGVAMLGAIGYELLATPRYSIDLQGRLLVGSYEGIDDQISAAHIGVGFNWF